MNKFISIVVVMLLLVLTTCKDRSHSNPFDPKVDLNPDDWAPSNLQATPLNDSQIRLTWEQEDDRIEGFRIQSNAESSDYTLIKELTADSTNYTDTGLILGQTYIYRVNSYTEVNESAYKEVTYHFWRDCINEWEGSAYLDECNECVGGNSDLGENYLMDCAGICNGSSYEDACSICDDNPANDNTDMDCAGICNGESYEDDCGVCDDDPLNDNLYFEEPFVDVNGNGIWDWVEPFQDINNTGLYESGIFGPDSDCNGDCFGTANINNCYVCVGGETGHAENNCYPVGDIDGNIYQTILIGNQRWMAENLKVTHYRNGDEIPTGYSNSGWIGLSSGAFAVYDDDPANTETYGNLYNWYAVNDTRDICPEGWHVQTSSEWQELEDYLGGNGIAGGSLKATGTIEGGDGLWYAPNGGATNSSGFTGLPGGKRLNYNGNYTDMGNYGFFWTSTTDTSTIADIRLLSSDSHGVGRGQIGMRNGSSVRCVGE
ncbi:MAG: fibronectin type III domain-containing protein [Candidatus Marinimicrobia bacterium]|nr:fibronectin type III domain-containing protein [Candidatus Neomarinimicrobiota bacterium]